MRRDLNRRLAALEAITPAGTPPCRTWLDAGDGLLRNGDTVMTEAAFKKAFPKAIRITLKLGEPLADPPSNDLAGD